MKIRSREFKTLLKTAFVRSIVATIMFAAPILVSVSTFSVYAAAGYNIKYFYIY